MEWSLLSQKDRRFHTEKTSGVAGLCRADAECAAQTTEPENPRAGLDLAVPAEKTAQNDAADWFRCTGSRAALSSIAIRAKKPASARFVFRGIATAAVGLAIFFSLFFGMYILVKGLTIWLIYETDFMVNALETLFRIVRTIFFEPVDLNKFMAVAVTTPGIFFASFATALSVRAMNRAGDDARTLAFKTVGSIVIAFGIYSFVCSVVSASYLHGGWFCAPVGYGLIVAGRERAKGKHG